MKFIVLIVFAASVAVVSGQEKATYIDQAKFDAGFATSATLLTSKDYTIITSRRTEAGQVEVHDKETDLFYVVDGAATFLTGGKMIGGKSTTPGQWLGTGMEGGEVHHLKKGDFILIPAGMAHWFKEVPKSINYYVVKVIKP